MARQKLPISVQRNKGSLKVLIEGKPIGSVSLKELVELVESKKGIHPTTDFTQENTKGKAN